MTVLGEVLNVAVARCTGCGLLVRWVKVKDPDSVELSWHAEAHDCAALPKRSPSRRKPDGRTE